jgi:hypothetical protein
MKYSKAKCQGRLRDDARAFKERSHSEESVLYPSLRSPSCVHYVTAFHALRCLFLSLCLPAAVSLGLQWTLLLSLYEYARSRSAHSWACLAVADAAIVVHIAVLGIVVATVGAQNEDDGGLDGAGVQRAIIWSIACCHQLVVAMLDGVGAGI